MSPLPRKLRAPPAAGVLTAALALPIGAAAAAESGRPVQGSSLQAPGQNSPLAPATESAGPAGAAEGGESQGSSGSGSTDGSGVTENAPLAPEVIRHPTIPQASGGNTSEVGISEQLTKGEEEVAEAETEQEADEAAERVGKEAGIDKAAPAFQIPSLSASTCAAAAVPPILVPIYQRAAAQYGLGFQGPAILAGINAVETGFGTNMGPSSAGAEGWMQFMPSTWAEWGVDAKGDGIADPDNPEDAIFSAARYLAAAGMPTDTYGAIYAYNHADWYVSEVLADAGCYAAEVGDTSFTAAGLTPQIEVLKCQAAPGWKKQIPVEYLEAFEAAAARYELGKRGVWALAAIARLESNFGKGMSKKQLEVTGPLGLEASEWKQFRVDADGAGQLRHAGIVDSALTLAREIWSTGSLEAGVFAHNQAAWYVEE